MSESVFENVFECLNPNRLGWGEDDPLTRAVKEKNYAALYAGLRKLEEPMGVEETLGLMEEVIDSGGTLRAFRTVMEHGPDPETLCSHNENWWRWGERRYGRLMTAAAQEGRSDILALLMERDTAPDPSAEEALLGAALRGGSLVCCELLWRRREGRNWCMTDEILREWGRAGTDPRTDRCLQWLSSKIDGMAPAPGGRLPLPEKLTMERGVLFENWDLVIRLCEERPVTVKEGKQTVIALINRWEEHSGRQLASVLSVLIAACPDLLRCRCVRYALAMGIITGGEEEKAILRPWLEKMPGRRINLTPGTLSRAEMRWMGSGGILTCWERELGKRYIPVLDRNSDLTRQLFRSDLRAGNGDALLEWLFARCPVSGKPPQGRVSQLGQTVLRHASPALLARMVQKGGVLEQEDRQAMLEWCEDRDLWNGRAVILAYREKETDYEL